MTHIHIKGTAKGFNLVSRVDKAIVIQEFGSDVICAFTYEDGSRCMRLAEQCQDWATIMDNPNNPHDDAMPLPHVLQEMREFRNWLDEG
jgi:hypothetical protein